MTITIIGVDCSTRAAHMGLALGILDEHGVRILATEPRPSSQEIHTHIRQWLPAHGPVLLALDAPLGWPAPLGVALASHRAGMPLDGERNNLFRRQTDYLVKKHTDQQSLDVGADRIARTAHAALQLLRDLRSAPETSIPLAWSPSLPDGISAIEVYPAATLRMHGLPFEGYKERGQRDVRMKIIKGLSNHLVLPNGTELLAANADALDAVVCVLAAADFLADKARKPDNLELAQREGWIWVLEKER